MCFWLLIYFLWVHFFHLLFFGLPVLNVVGRRRSVPQLSIRGLGARLALSLVLNFEWLRSWMCVVAYECCLEYAFSVCLFLVFSYFLFHCVSLPYYDAFVACCACVFVVWFCFCVLTLFVAFWASYGFVCVYVVFLVYVLFFHFFSSPYFILFFPVCMRVLLLVFSFFYRFLREAMVFRGLKIRVCLYLLRRICDTICVIRFA